MNIKRTIIAVLLLSISLMAASKNVQLDTWATSLNGVNATGAGDDYRLYEPSQYATYYTWTAISWQTSFTGTPTAITVQLQGSNNGTTWELLDTSTSTAGESRSVVGKFYDRIRCNISAYTVNSSTSTCKVKGIPIADVDVTARKVTAGEVAVGTTVVTGELNRGENTLNAFGDSITAGAGATTEAQRWVNLVAEAKGWTLNNQGIGGGSLPNIAASVYATNVTPTTVSTLLVGQNDGVTMVNATNGVYNWFHGLLGTYLWLLTPNKILANDAAVTKAGTWTDSDLVSFGIKSAEDNSTAQVSLLGTTVYVVAHGTNANAASFKVTVDSVDYGPYVAANNYTTKDSKYDIPWAVRISGLSNTLHTVTVTLLANNGSSLYLDYFASNAGQSSRTGPYLFTASPYKTDITWTYPTAMDLQVRTAVNQLASDGLNISHADVLGMCWRYNATYGCGDSDGVHPTDAGHSVLANAFLSEMDAFDKPSTNQAARFSANDTVHVVSKAFMPLAGSTGAPIVRMTVPSDLIIERVVVYMQNQMAGCTTPPRLVLCKGGCTVGTNAVVLLNGANSTGTITSLPIEVVWPASIDTWMQFQDGAGCSNFGSNFHVTWMYRMARD